MHGFSSEILGKTIRMVVKHRGGSVAVLARSLTIVYVSALSGA